MKATRALFGGGRHYHYPKSVWTPSGGWWVHLEENVWQRNTAIAFLGVATGAAIMFSVGSSKEVSKPDGVSLRTHTAMIVFVIKPSMALCLQKEAGRRTF